MASVTLIMIILTGLVSFRAFSSPALIDRMIFRPYSIQHNRQYERFLTSGLIHANWPHLLVNMWVLYVFGENVEIGFQALYGPIGSLYYLGLYVLALIVSCVPTYFKHKDNAYYAALGASGATSAVVFASILFYPTAKIGLLFIPIGVPAPIFGLLYLTYSVYMAKRGGDNIGHDAHFYGAVFGFGFPLLLKPGLFLYFLGELSII